MRKPFVLPDPSPRMSRRLVAGGECASIGWPDVNSRHTTTTAWPGAAPFSSRDSTFEQLSLFADLFTPRGRSSRTIKDAFDATGFRIRRLNGIRGIKSLLADFLGRHHYEASLGFPGPAFALEYTGEGLNELVGVATFGRNTHRDWAGSTFQATDEDYALLVAGMMTPEALMHRMVHESQYQELNRLALVSPDQTRAPLGTGAASWFVAKCLIEFEIRNRALWLARTASERGLPLTHEASHLLDRARFPDADSWGNRSGTGFTKVISSFADPDQGHVGIVYQALGFHHAGQSNGGRASPIRIGLRSGEAVHARTLSKARAGQNVAGHHTAVLRLAWEGADVAIRVMKNGSALEESSGGFLRDLEAAPHERDEAIRCRWADYQSACVSRHGADVEYETEYRGGGTRDGVSAAKHRYLRFMGSRFWQWEQAVRCVHLRDRLMDAAGHWEARGRRGKRPMPAGPYPKPLD